MIHVAPWAGSIQREYPRCPHARVRSVQNVPGPECYPIKKRPQRSSSEAAIPDASPRNQPHPSKRPALWLLVHMDNRHHPQVLMREDVAVINEVSDVHPAEVHEQLHLRGRALIRILHVVPEWSLDHVQELAVDGRRLRTAIDLEVVLGENLEVDLVHVEFMVLLSYVC